jgi:hypothetical protein
VPRRIKSKDIKNAATMEKTTNKRSEQPVRIATEQLCDIREKIHSGPDARNGLSGLDKAGFRMAPDRIEKRQREIQPKNPPSNERVRRPIQTSTRNRQ